MADQTVLIRKVGVAVIAVAVVAFVGVHFLKADKGRVMRVIREAERAIEAGDASAIENIFWDDYNYEGVTYHRLAEEGPRVFRDIAPIEVYIVSKKVEVKGRAANARISVIAAPGKGSHLVGSSGSLWRIGFEKRGSVWKVSEVENLSVNGRGGYRLENLVEAMGYEPH